MPPIIRYKVTEEREVIVSATSPDQAAALASRVFSGTKKPEDQINVITEVRVTELNIREESY